MKLLIYSTLTFNTPLPPLPLLPDYYTYQEACRISANFHGNIIYHVADFSKTIVYQSNLIIFHIHQSRKLYKTDMNSPFTLSITLLFEQVLDLNINCKL